MKRHSLLLLSIILNSTNCRIRWTVTFHTGKHGVCKVYLFIYLYTFWNKTSLFPFTAISPNNDLLVSGALLFFIKGLWKLWQILATLKESLVTISSRLHIEAGEDRTANKCKTTAKTLNKQLLAAGKGDDTRDWGMASKNCQLSQWKINVLWKVAWIGGFWKTAWKELNQWKVWNTNYVCNFLGVKLDLIKREDRFLVALLRDIFGATDEEETGGWRQNWLRKS